MPAIRVLSQLVFFSLVAHGCARTELIVGGPATPETFVTFQMQGSVLCAGTDTTALTRCRGSVVSEWSAEPFSTSTAIHDFSGMASVCVLGVDQVVRCRGSNRTGLLATPLIRASSDDIPIRLPGPATQISSGYYLACARLADQSVWCWGLDPFEGRPYEPEPLDVPPASHVAVGSHFDSGVVAVISDGRLFVLSRGVDRLGSRPASGRLTPEHIEYPRRITSVSVSDFGDGLSAVDATGALLLLGTLESAQRLPWTPSGTSREERHFVLSHRTLTVADDSVDALTAVSGANHVCVLTRGGRVLCLGANDFGQIGDGSNIPRRSLIDVGLTGIRMIRAAGDRTCALNERGSILCWGRDFADARSEWALRTIPTGAFETFALREIALPQGRAGYITTEAGELLGWATNSNQAPALLGTESDDPTGARAPRRPLRPVIVPLGSATLPGVQPDARCVVLTSGRLTCWLDPIDAEPRLVETPFVVRSVAASASEVCVVGRDEQFACATMQFRGDSTLLQPWRSHRSLPAATAVVAATSHICATSGDGAVYCWGSNAEGQLGVTGIAASEVPVRVPGLSDARQIAVSYGRSCAVTSDKTYCWGLNVGHSFSASLEERIVAPTQIAAPEHIVAISTGDDSTCAVGATGRVLCTGSNYWGQLGVGWSSRGSTEWVYPPLAEARSISAGGQSYCAVLREGSARCWGSRRFNEFGEGISGVSLSPAVFEF